MSFLMPKAPTIVKPPSPAAPPTSASADVQQAGQAGGDFSSLISTGATGLKRKANTQKSSLIGGA